MRRIVSVCGSLGLIVAAFGALADVPPSAPPVEGAAPAAAPAAPATAPSGTAAPVTDSTQKGGLTDVDVRRALAKYRKTNRKGEILYCRVEKPLGTRIGKTYCYTEDQVLIKARAERDAQNILSQRGLCTSANSACVAQ